MNSEADLVPVDSSQLSGTEMTMTRPARIVLQEAESAAKVLKEVIARKPKPVMMNGEQYLEYEDWATIARFYGVTAKVKETRFVDYGDAKGFEATAVALLVSTGQEISQADSMCLNDEERWSVRPKYEWKNGKRTQIGSEPVPLFQLRSMAQTRASAKVLRNVFSWIAVLGGYKPTPAEEMDGVQGFNQQQQQTDASDDPKRKSDTSSAATGTGKINDKQASKIWAIAYKHNRKDDVKPIIKSFGFDDVKDVTNDKIDLIIAALEQSDAAE